MARTAVLQVVAPDELRGRLKKIADAEGIPQAVVVREILEHGVSWRERVSAKRVG